ncbi:hypothetical protein MP228_000035 [Amoeboaphelidium protococcarum]|nr:hypothetical protein MP228_000035 [Amoeboaphelidium protococcarum]
MSLNSLSSFVSDEEAVPFFDAINSGDSTTVRKMLSEDKSLTLAKRRSEKFKYDSDVELEAFKFLGAYIGAVTGLQLALMIGRDDIAKDIIDDTLEASDFDVTYGGGNTALHLAVFLNANEVVKALIDRGCNPHLKNNKGYSALDIADTQEMRLLFE